MPVGGDGPTTPNLVRPTLVRMTALPLRVVEVPAGIPGANTAREALAARLAGTGEPFALVPAPGRFVSPEYAAMIRRCVHPDLPVTEPDTVLVAATSGSTGEPRGVVITSANLHAAVEGASERIDGLAECAWVLALPVTSIGGLGVVVRAYLSGTPLHVLPSIGGAAAFDALDLSDLRVEGPFAVSLVPRQLNDMLAHPRATAWLGRAHAVLVGAAATPDVLAEQARAAGVALVTTYGMTETTGGCVYDGVPLPGVGVDVDAGGRIAITGRQVAAGYRGDAGDGFSGTGSSRRFLTADRGTWAGGRLTITGRTDDVVQVHGVSVSLAAVEAIIRDTSGVRDCAVVAVPDDRAGHRVLAYVSADRPDLEGIDATVAARLGGAARPRVIPVDSLPLLPNGKIDRLALRAAGD